MCGRITKESMSNYTQQQAITEASSCRAVITQTAFMRPRNNNWQVSNLNITYTRGFIQLHVNQTIHQLKLKRVTNFPITTTLIIQN